MKRSRYDIRELGFSIAAAVVIIMGGALVGALLDSFLLGLCVVAALIVLLFLLSRVLIDGARVGAFGSGIGHQRSAPPAEEEWDPRDERERHKSDARRAKA